MSNRKDLPVTRRWPRPSDEVPSTMPERSWGIKVWSTTNRPYGNLRDGLNSEVGIFSGIPIVRAIGKSKAIKVSSISLLKLLLVNAEKYRDTTQTINSSIIYLTIQRFLITKVLGSCAIPTLITPIILIEILWIDILYEYSPYCQAPSSTRSQGLCLLISF